MNITITINDFFNIIEKPLPKEYEAIADNVIEHFNISNKNIAKRENFHKNTIYINEGIYNAAIAEAKVAVKEGAYFVISKYQIFDDKNNEVPTLIVDNVIDVGIKVIAYISSFFKGQKIVITGTVGKTTIKEMINTVLQDEYNILYSISNSNNRTYVSQYIQMLDNHHDIYLQEVGASSFNGVESCARMIVPNISIIGNVGYSHLKNYLTKENILYDKLSVLRHLDKDGLCLLNYDDIELQKVTSTKQIEFYSLENPKAYYYGCNIFHNNENNLEMDIHYEGKSIHIVTNIFGIHNAYNLLATFAVCKRCGIADEEFIQRIKKYSTTGSRQNFVKIGKYNFILDSFNASSESLIAGIQALDNYKAELGKKIAILGPQGEYASLEDEIFQKVGNELVKYSVDLFIIHQDSLEKLIEILRKHDKNIITFKDGSELISIMKSNIEINDTIYMKAKHKEYYSKYVDFIYGTNFYWNYYDARKKEGKIRRNSSFKYIIMNNSIVIDEYLAKDSEVIIPNEIDGFPIKYISKRAFKDKSIKKIVLNDNISGIGMEAFANTKIEKIVIPSNVKLLAKNAFLDCVLLKEVIIDNGMIHIEKNAFKNCTGLKCISLPDSIQFISSRAFTNVYSDTVIKTDNNNILKKIPDLKKYMKKDNKLYYRIITRSIEKGFRMFRRIKKIFKRQKKKKLKEKKELEKKSLKNNTYVNVVCKATGWTYEEAQEKMDKLKTEYGISYKVYVHREFYNLSDKKQIQRIKYLKKRDDSFIYMVCDASGWSYDKAKAEMERVKKKFNVSYYSYAHYLFYKLSDEEIAQKLKDWNDTFNEQVNYAIQESGWSRKKVREHMIRIKTTYNFSASVYILYRIWELDDEQLNTYAGKEDSNRLFMKYNDIKQTALIKDKVEFNKLYKNYTKRKFWVNADTNYEEFLEFIDGLEYIFCKPINSGGGQGTEKIKVSDYSFEELYNYLINKERLLIEESVSNHQEISEFAPKSLNTIRVITLLKDDNVNILTASFRFGNKDIVDNFHKDGMVCAVDVESGEIITDAIDRWGNTYEYHPVSQKKFKGFKVPRWDEVIQTVQDAIKVQEGVNYVGWDIAVCNDKVVIIEGNSAPGLSLIQAPYAKEGIGQKHIFSKY